jgi:DNA-binding GntR family transcriptional regulator
MDPAYRRISNKLLTLSPGKTLTTREIARPLKISTTTIIKRLTQYGITPEVTQKGHAHRVFKWNTSDVLVAVQKEMAAL